MKLLKNKFFVTVVALAIVLSVIPTVLSLTGHTDILRSGLSVVATPFRAAFNWAADGIIGFGEYFSGVDSLIEENDRLRAELEKYQDAAARAELYEGENSWLREQIGFAGKYSEYTMVDAKITGRSSNNYSETFTLNRGSESGVKVNMAVITPAGVVGYIKEVGLGWSRAVTLTDPTSAVGVYTATGIYGTVEGSVEYRTDGFCVMNSAAKLETDTVLYSSGYGNIYPAGLAVGRVVSSEKDKYGHIYTYKIAPSVDFDSLTTVMIVTAKTVSSEPPESDGDGNVG